MKGKPGSAADPNRVVFKMPAFVIVLTTRFGPFRVFFGSVRVVFRHRAMLQLLGRALPVFPKSHPPLFVVSPASRFFFFFFFLVKGEEKKTTSGDFSQVFVGLSLNVGTANQITSG